MPSTAAANMEADHVSDVESDAILQDAASRQVIEDYLSAQGLPALTALPLDEQRLYARQLAAILRSAAEDATRAIANEKPQLHDEHVARLLASAEVCEGIGKFTQARLGLSFDSFFGEERERLVRAMFAAGDLRLSPCKGGVIQVDFPTLAAALAADDDELDLL